MTWSPTAGMLKAESIVQTMLTDATTRHVFITDPILRHRWVQTIADALDGFQPAVSTLDPAFLEERDEPQMNGLYTLTDGQELVRVDPASVMPDYIPTGDMTVSVRVPNADAQPKRRAGRPKGAKNRKKAKAAKAPVEPVEAAAS